MARSNELTAASEGCALQQKIPECLAEFVRAIGAIEVKKRRSWRDAVKATKSRLHQVAGAYLDRQTDFSAWLDLLRQSSGDPAEMRRTSLRIMANHASTRERLPYLDEFYQVIFADLPPVTSVLDLACGLNPLSLSWMPLPNQVAYRACDLFQDQIDFLNSYFQCVGAQGQATVCDLVFDVPPAGADLVLLLKTIPCLEQMDKSAGARLLDKIDARYMIVSYPVRSLGGRSKGMLSNYAEHFNALVRDKPWKVERFEFPTELVFRIEKKR